MRAIFISYRRTDAEGQAGRLFDDLKQRFGADAVFMDVAGLEAGRDFRKAIDDQVATCGVLLTIIGKSWLSATDEKGGRRLDDPTDFVHLETASALKRDIPVVPVLVQGARMPAANELPEALKDLSYRNAVELTHARWDSDVELLIKALQPIVQPKSTTSPRSTPSRMVPFAGGAVLVLLALAGYAWYLDSQPPNSVEATMPPADEPASSPSAEEPPGTPPAEAEPNSPPADEQPAATDEQTRVLGFRDWKGNWQLRYKFQQDWYEQEMTMQADQSGITADYGIGTLEGQFEEGGFAKANGEFTNTAGTGTDCASGKQGGAFQLVLAKDGQSMHGWWDVCGEGTKWPWEAEKR